MLRRCDGTDPNLLKASDPAKVTRPIGAVKGWREEFEPCKCGLVFNDVNRLVIYPHERF